jgi:hypothetical protein
MVIDMTALAQQEDLAEEEVGSGLVVDEQPHEEGGGIESESSEVLSD